MAEQQQTPAGLTDVPHLSASREQFIRAFGVFSLVVTIAWLYWRWNYTLNPDAMWFSVLLVSAETWGLVISGLFLFNAWRIPPFEAPPPLHGRTVDVFITVYDEPLEVLRRTVIGAGAIRYPHRTYILDDGKRDDVAGLAREMAVGYIRRSGNANAKAGNLNHAISVTNGEFILQLDTDHVPLPDIVDRLIGYFADEQVAFVQTPQDFYNTDSFTHVLNDNARSLWEENRIFYSLLQPGKDHWNASFFCGSCGMLRRSAIESIGGFSTTTIIEDMETSIALHTRGWRSRYHQEALAFGLSPGTASAFHVQRMRWAQGSMQVLRKMNPLFLPGLTMAQRISYVSASLYPFDGVQKLIFYGSPVLFLLTGLVPIKADTTLLMSLLIPYLAITIASFEMTARGTGYILIAERYNVAKFWTFMVASLALFTNRKLKFNVTPKGMGGVPLSTYAPQLVLLVVSGAALVWAPLAFRYGWVDYQVESFDLAFGVSMLWVLWNVYFAWGVVRLSRDAQQNRSDHRFIDSLPVRIRRADGALPEAWPSDLVMGSNLNPSGMAFRSTFAVPRDTELLATLPLSTGTLEARGRVVHTTEEVAAHGSVFVQGVQFHDLPVADSDAIEMHCTHHTVPIWRKRHRQSVDLLARMSEVMRNSRMNARTRVELPARIHILEPDRPPAEIGGLVEEMSSSGARLLLDGTILPGTRLRFDVPGTSIAASGVAVFAQALESSMGVCFTVGVELNGARHNGGGGSANIHSSARVEQPAVGGDPRHNSVA